MVAAIRGWLAGLRAPHTFELMTFRQDERVH